MNTINIINNPSHTSRSQSQLLTLHLSLSSATSVTTFLLVTSLSLSLVSVFVSNLSYVMASATVDHHTTTTTTTTITNNHLNLECLPHIDLNLLSQSELLSLSLCSSSSSPSPLSDVVLTPKIDRSVFNESAGSRKQTFSRLRLAPRNQSPHNNSRISRHTPNTATTTTTTEPLDVLENSQIISHLKSLFSIQSNNNDDDHLVPVHVEYKDYPLPTPPPLQLHDVPIGVAAAAATATSSGTKRKRGRGRPRKDENRNMNMDVKDLVLMNKNGAIVDLVALASVEDPFADEFNRWTEGMENEDELLAFLAELKGEWASRRKKKKIVDASHFGNVLPVGWKLMLCIKKNAGHVWLACRRYIRFLF